MPTTDCAISRSNLSKKPSRMARNSTLSWFQRLLGTSHDCRRMAHDLLDTVSRRYGLLGFSGSSAYNHCEQKGRDHEGSFRGRCCCLGLDWLLRLRPIESLRFLTLIFQQGRFTPRRPAAEGTCFQEHHHERRSGCRCLGGHAGRATSATHPVAGGQKTINEGRGRRLSRSEERAGLAGFHESWSGRILPGSVPSGDIPCPAIASNLRPSTA